MKSYNHTKQIDLRKQNIVYCNRITGYVISWENIVWEKDKYSRIKYAIIDKTLYTYKTFHDDFGVYISRLQELQAETIKNRNDQPYSNQNGREYSRDLWIPNGYTQTRCITYDLVADPGYSDARLDSCSNIDDYKLSNLRQATLEPKSAYFELLDYMYKGLKNKTDYTGPR